MIYTDGVHLIADDECELHTFAQSIGLKREWFQNHRHGHYDLTTKRKRDEAIRRGARLVTSRGLIRILRRN